MPIHLPVKYPINRVPDQSDSKLVGAWLNKKTDGAKDYSVNELDGTVSGGVILGGHEGVGADFDGSTGYITILDNSIFDFGADDFTIEAFIKSDDMSSTHWIYDQRDSAIDGILFGLNSGKLYCIVNSVTVVFNTTISSDQWIHIILVRNGNTLKGYINGSLDPTTGDVTGQSINTTTNPRIGARSFTSPSSYFDGQIRELNIFSEAKSDDWIIDRCKQAIPDDSLRLYIPKGDRDYSRFRNTLTRSGGVIVGREIELDGSTGYITITDGSIFDFGTGNFTISSWVYLDTVSANQHIYDQRDGVNDGIRLHVTSAAQIILNANDKYIVGSTLATADKWLHIVGVRNGNTMELFLNSISIGTVDVTGESIDTTVNPVIGARSYGGAANFLDGKIREFELFNEVKSIGWAKSEYLRMRKFV